jgi:predicted glutamine amidotransferase
MCRYIAYIGEPIRLADLLYRPRNGLIHQASEAMESRTRINADGFGIGWYQPGVDPEPAVFKDVTPAWNNANLRSLSDKVASPCILAHVRAARGFDPVSRANCHPFQHRRLLWMHNGDIPGRGRLHRRVCGAASDALVARISGNTDTELAFVLFLGFLDSPPDGDVGSGDLARALERTVETLAGWWAADGDTRPIVMNFCVSTGKAIAASRVTLGGPEVPSLHYCSGSAFSCSDGICSMHHAGTGRRCVIVSSEKLTADPEWADVRNGELVIVREDLDVEVRRIEALAAH